MKGSFGALAPKESQLGENRKGEGGRGMSREKGAQSRWCPLSQVSLHFTVLFCSSKSVSPAACNSNSSFLPLSLSPATRGGQSLQVALVDSKTWFAARTLTREANFYSVFFFDTNDFNGSSVDFSARILVTYSCPTVTAQSYNYF